MAIEPRFNATIDADISKFMRKAATVDKTIKQMATGVIVDIGAEISGFMRRAATVQNRLEELDEGATVEINANARDFTRTAREVQRETNDLSRRVTEARIGADIKTFERRMIEVVRALEEADDTVTPQIELEMTQFTRDITAVQERMREIARSTADPQVEADIGGFMAQMAAVQAQLDIVTREHDVDIRVDATTASARISALWLQLRALTVRNFVVDIKARWNNYQEVMGQIATFSRNIGEVAGITARGGMMVIAPAAVPVIASAVGLIGNLGPMLGTIAGSAFALLTSFGAAGLGAAGFAAVAIPSIGGVIETADELKDIEEKIAKADTWKKRNKLMKEQSRILAGMSKAQAAAGDALKDFKKSYADLVSDMENPVLDVFASALTGINKVLQMGRPMIENATASIQKLMDSFNANLDAVDVKAFFRFLSQYAGPAIETIGKAVGNFTMGLFNMMEAFGPLSTETQNGFLKMSESFRNWSAVLSENDKFKSFVSYVSENMPKIRSIFSDAIQGVINMFAGFSGSSSDMMTSLQNLMERFKNFSSTISQNKGFQNFLDYFKTNGPVVVSAIGEIIKFIVNFGIALAPMGEKILSVIDSFLNWSNGMMQAHPWLGKLAAGALLVVGGLTALAPVVLLTNALFGGLIITMVKTVAKMTWAAVTMVAKWLWMATQATAHAIRVGAAWLWTTGVQMVTALARMAASAAIFVAKWLWMGVQAGLHAIKVAAAWTLSTGVAMVTAVAKMTATAAIFVAKWVWMGVQSLLAAARMAAAWFIALGPIGWITAAVVGLAILIIANWDKISAWTKQTWSTVSNWISTKWSEISAKTSAKASEIWNTVSTKFSEIVNSVKEKMSNVKTTIQNKWEEAKSATVAKIAAMVSAVVSKFSEIVSNVKSKMSDAKTALSNKWEEAKSATSSKLSALVSTAATFFSNLVSKVREKMGEAVRVLGQKVGEMPGKVRSFKNQMLSAGADLVRGLINGIKNMGKEAIEAISGVVDGVIGKAKSLLKIKSPSRVFMEIGDFVGQGLAKGVTGTAKQVAAAGATLASKLTKAMTDKKTTKIQSARLMGVKVYAARQIVILQDIAKQRENVAAKIKTASQKLADAVKVRDDFAKSVADNAKAFASVTNIDAKTGGDFAAQMKEKLKAITDFQANIKKLQKAGLNATTLQDLINAGVDGGGAKAATLAGSSTGIIKDINNTQSAINKASSSLGKDAANQFYGLGVDAAKGIVKGLESQAKALEKSANKISDTLVKAVKKRLNIHSPSRVFAELGAFVSEGLAIGVSDKSKAAITSVGSMAASMTGAFNPKLAMADMQASAQLDTSIKRNDMRAVRHSFAAEVGAFEIEQPDMYLLVDGKKLGKVVAGSVKEENDRNKNMIKIGRGGRG